MFRAPVRRATATDSRGNEIGRRLFYEGMDEDQLSEIARLIPNAKVTDRGGLVEVFVPKA